MSEKAKLQFLEEFIGEINVISSSGALINYLLDKCMIITEAIAGSVVIVDTGTALSNIIVTRGFDQNPEILGKISIKRDINDLVLRNGSPIIINDITKEVSLTGLREDLISELVLPLKIDEKVIGVINLHTDKTGVFNGGHIETLRAITDFSAQKIQRLFLIEELNDKIKKQDILLKITDILQNQMDIEKMFEEVMNTISKTIDIKRGSLVLLDNDDKLKITASYKLSKDAIERGVYQIGEGITGKVFQSGQSVSIKNIAESKEFLNKMKIKRGRGEKNSFFSAPIRYENKVVGVFSAEKEFISDNDCANVYEIIIIIASMISNKVYNYVISLREKNKLLKENKELREKLSEKDNVEIFIGKNKKIIDMLHISKQIALTEATALITGETGSGKEVLARYIHSESGRKANPFISINCAAIPDNLLESELFGFKKGAFTGANGDKKGKFQLANTGTIFLDEIGDLDFNLQAKILRVLQEKRIEPLGSEKSLAIDVRIIAATNKDLRKLISENKFREDLYYRLNVIHIEIPSLSSRKDDIPLFIEYFINLYSKKYNKNVINVTQNCRQILENYNWPGNVREFQNVIERAVILSNGYIIDETLLPEELLHQKFSNSVDSLKDSVISEIKKSKCGEVFQDVIGKVEQYLIEYAMINCNNKQIEAADFLGLHRNTLYNKIKSS